MDLPNWSSLWVKENDIPDVTTKIITREEWGALPPKGGIDPLPTPVEHVGYACNRDITWNKCMNRQDCSKILRMMQKKHMEEGFPDIKYNFLIGDDGFVYEGRGWHKRPQIYYDRPQRKSLGSLLDVAFIGIGESNWVSMTEYEVYEAFLRLGKQEKMMVEEVNERNFCDTLELNPLKGEKDKFDSNVEEEEEEEEE